MQLSGIRYIFFATVFLAGLCFAKIARVDNQNIVSLTREDSGKTLTIKKGGVFEITLPDHVDGGYRFDSVQYDPAMISLQKHSASPPPPNSAAGHSGSGTWVFAGIKKGTTAIKITATRPWKGGGTVAVFENKVVVK